MPVFLEGSSSSGRPICRHCGYTVGGWPFGDKDECWHSSIIEYPTDEECGQCGEPYLPATGLMNPPKTYTLPYQPARPSCDCEIEESNGY